MKLAYHTILKLQTIFAGISAFSNKNGVFMHPTFIQKKAFTLAETLITLSIIGVVAAMTVPTLQAKYTEQITVNKVKKFYSLLSNAYVKAIAENGHPDTWGIDGTGKEQGQKLFEILVAPSFKIAKDCGFDNTKKCMTDSDYKWLNGNNIRNWYAGNSGGMYYYKIVLEDGSSVWFRGDQDVYINAFIDVNGPRTPNQWGKDLFSFAVKDGKLIPSGTPGYRNSFDDACNSKTSGFGCAAWVVYKHNLEYLNCDDLKWNGKQKCSK